MRIVFMSDLHVSRYGGRMGLLRSGRRRVARDGEEWEPVWEESGWHIERRAPGGALRREALYRLHDSNGELHKILSMPKGESDKDVISELRRIQGCRLSTSHATLTHRFPDADAVREGLDRDPTNANLRFCAAALAVRASNADWVVITGDLTDDCIGYDLVLAGLAPFVRKRRLICIAGNHDIYATPPLWTPNALRKTEDEKRQLWGNFSEQLGQPRHGAFVRDLGEGAVLACLDSCHPPRSLLSASGMIPKRQLTEIGEVLRARSGKNKMRIVCMHHHVVNLPPMGLGRAPWQPGMRLRNATDVLDALREMKLSAVLNGHRHVGYQFKPAGGPPERQRATPAARITRPRRWPRRSRPR